MIKTTSVVYKELKNLNTPEKIQDFLNKIKFNFEKGGETYRSVEETLKAKKAHCFEGALIACGALWLIGEKPLLMDLRTAKGDVDHVVALFRRGKYWGAISKTNHAVLRYREPVYRSPRELAMSYFHEYFLNDGRKTLREFSKPFDLSKTKFDWLFSKKDLFGLVDALDNSPHDRLIPKGTKLRRADKIETKAGKIVEYK
jgi:hypothetical protein